MTNIERIIRNEETLAEFLDKYCYSDDNPMIKWFNTTYCNNCEAVEKEDEHWGLAQFSYCELNNKCRFFPKLNEVPSGKCIIKMWLNLEYNQEDFENEQS